MGDLGFRVHGIDVLLSSEDHSYMDYISTNLAAFRSDRSTEPNLKVSYAFTRGEGYEIRPNNDMERIGRNIWQGRRSVLLRSRGIEVISRLVSEEELEVEAKYHLRDPPTSKPRKLLRRLRGRNRLGLRKNEITHFAARMSFHLPLFWLMTNRKGLSLIHGSSVCVDGRALVFAGLNNSGKSTLAASLSVSKGWPQMSDNFTLVNDRRIFAYPESQRISMDMIPSLPHVKDGKPTYGKLHMHQDGTVPLEAEIEAIYFLSFGESPSLRRMELEEGLDRIQAIHDYISEFPEYTYLRFLEDRRIDDARSRFEALFSRSRLYALVQSAKPDLDQTQRLIEGSLDHVK